MRKIIALLITGMLAFGIVTADEVVINPDVPNRYTVVKGDTLWGIAEMFLQDPWKWQEIWYNNPQIENPDLIYPGDIIALIQVGGQPRLTVINRAGSSNTLKITPAEADDDGVVKLRPNARITPITTAIPAIPRDYIESFLSGNRIVPDRQLRDAPYVIRGPEGRLILGAGDKIYGRGEFTSDLPVYQIFSIGESYKDPASRELLGYEAVELGSARLTDLNGDIATFSVERSNQQIAIGDRILPSDQTLFETIFYPSEPPEGLQGVIMDVSRGTRFIGQFDVVLINLGEREGVAAGNVFRVNRLGERVRDPITNKRLQLPDEEAGLMMVFRTFEKMAYALILSAELPMRVGDPIVNPGF